MWTLNQYMDSDLEEAIYSWNGPTGARHDFQFYKGSIEVKTTSKAGSAPVVRIANLEQLADAVTGSLSLFVIQVSEDALSANGLVSEVWSLPRKNRAKTCVEDQAVGAPFIGRVHPTSRWSIRAAIQDSWGSAYMT